MSRIPVTAKLDAEELAALDTFRQAHGLSRSGAVAAMIRAARVLESEALPPVTLAEVQGLLLLAARRGSTVAAVALERSLRAVPDHEPADVALRGPLTPTPGPASARR